jgi:hypothetical protein
MANAYEEFEMAYREWRAARPVLPSADESRTARYGFEIDMDHLASYLGSLSESAAAGSTKVDWQNVVAEYFEDLAPLEERLRSLVLPAELHSTYSEFLSRSRLLLEKIASLCVPAEGHLGFTASVLREFSFLESEYGFKLVESSPICVRYESDQVYMEMQYVEDPTMIFTMGRLREPAVEEGQFWLDDVAFVHGLGLDFPLNLDRVDLKSREGVSLFIRDVAQFVRHRAHGLLSNAPDAWTALVSAQKKRDEEYAALMKERYGENQEPS